MGRRKAHAPLNVLINNRPVGRLDRAQSGAVSFRYDQAWLDWPNGFGISLSMPRREAAYTGAEVSAVFDNLLPDSDHIRKQVAERLGAGGSDYFSLLSAIGRDCVGAMQFLPDDAPDQPPSTMHGQSVTDADIETLLANLARAPLGLAAEQDFRISIAGAQEKTALLRLGTAWLQPRGTTPTSHILKPQLGKIPTAFGTIDLRASVDNEHYCLELLRAFGLAVANSQIVTFGQRRVLVVERFDRRWRDDRLLRLPQEDMCQALGIPSSRKYQSSGGPDMVAILKLLQGADDPRADQLAFFKSQILFWLIGATDGHAKNFSLLLKPGDRYSLSPFYDVLSAQPACDGRQIPRNRFKLAMSFGTNRKYVIDQIAGRHFIETGRLARLGNGLMRQALEEILADAATAPDAARARMPADFDEAVHASIVAILPQRLQQVAAALAELPPAR